MDELKRIKDRGLRRTVRFPPEIAHVAKVKAAELGMDVQGYLMYLIVKDATLEGVIECADAMDGDQPP